MGLYPNRPIVNAKVYVVLVNTNPNRRFAVWLVTWDIYFQTLTQPYLITQTMDFDFISNALFLSLSLSYKALQIHGIRFQTHADF